MVCVFTFPLLGNSVATVTAIKGQVKIENNSKNREALLGSKLNEQDSIITADKSKAQIIFKDETIVTIGKKSHFSISKYIFEANSEPVVEYKLFKGAMRTISGRIGKIAPQKFKVKTKTATIGIRGTNFTVIESDKGSMYAYCTYGAISATIDSKEYIVKQGYYLVLDSQGKSIIAEFSAEALKEMNTDYFGERIALKGENVEKSEVIDTTKDVFDNIVIRDITKQSQDAIQTRDVSSSTNILMSGLSRDNDNFSGQKPAVSLSFSPDGATFDTTNSWLEVLDKSNSSGNGESDNWKLFLASTPTSFTSRDNFSVNFSSVTLTPLLSSTSTNAVLSSGILTATTDLSSGDYMSWGQWNANVSFASVQSGSLTTASHHFKGLWVTGEPTDAAVVAALSGNLSYVGKYQVFGTNNSVFSVEEGTANLQVNFTADQATLTISANTGNAGGTLVGSNYQFSNMAINGNTVSGGTISAGSGYANGTFYGANGKSVGGNFNIRDGSTIDVQGVYQVTAP